MNVHTTLENTARGQIGARGMMAHRRVWSAIAAHVLELGHSGVIDDAALAALARGLDAAREPAGETGDLGSVIAAIDERVDAIVPPAVSGAVSLGRRHHELRVTVLRLAGRDVAIALLETVDDLRDELQRLATEHVLTYLPGLVDGQAAEPTTFANVLGGTIDPLEQAAVALRQAFERLNRSPLGAGLLAGDVLEPDRAALAARLGFDGDLSTTFNAASNVEDFVALAQACAGALAPASRLLRDVALWLRAEPDSFRLDDAWLTRPEPGMVTLDPYGGLHKLIYRIERVGGGADALVTSLRALDYGPVGGAVDAVLAGLDELRGGATSALDESTALFGSLQPNRAFLANRVGRGLITSSDLALYLVTEEGVPLPAARQIAGMVVARALEGGSGLVGITPDAIDTAAMLAIGQDVKTEMEPLGRHFAPRRYLERRRVAGAPAPDMTRAWLAERQQRLDADRVWLNTTRVRLHEAMTALDRAIADAASDTE